MNRPITTLFMLESLDGKISTGNSDKLDVDKDFCRIDGVKEGLHQYYEIESTTGMQLVGTASTEQEIKELFMKSVIILVRLWLSTINFQH